MENRISRPIWMTLNEEREIRKTMTTSKLQACKDMLVISKNNNIDRSIFGLKSAKDIIDSWSGLGPNPLNNLKDLVLKLKSIKEELPDAINDAFPTLSEEHKKRAIEDLNFLENTLLGAALNGEKFGI